MRVLFVHVGDAGWGGGQIQMLRLQTALRRRGVEARILCRDRTREDSVALPRRDRLERLIRHVTCRLGLNEIHCLGSFDIPGTEAFRRADVLDFHCLHNNFFNYLALPTLSRSKPVVLTLHDMWPLTGHCHHSLDCTRWTSGCGRCPYLDVPPAVDRDATRWEWRLKRWAYARSRLTLVAPSAWLAGLARQSILGHLPVHHIPNGVDTTIFRPLDPAMCRDILGIPPGKKVLLFVADNMTRRLKGSDLLVHALQQLPPSLRQDLFVLLLGHRAETMAKLVQLPGLNLGFVSSHALKVIAYSAAHLFAFPTRADNFPLVVLESLACGTPVVSYRVGGVPESVRHHVTGYVAEPGSAAGLAAGIVELLDGGAALDAMRSVCRRVVLREYGLPRQVSRYITLYRSLCDGQAVTQLDAAAPAPAVA
jgi:glycosyltransferase involved in cell wall biosynthesis